MEGKVVDLSTYARQMAPQHDQDDGVEAEREPIIPWLADVLFTATTARFAEPATASVRLVIDLDPLHQQWEVEVWSENWQRIATLHGAEQGVLRFLNDLMCASMGDA